MTADLATLPAATLPTVAADLSSAGRYASAARASNTVAAYAADIAAFQSWCKVRNVSEAAPESVAAWIADLADQGAAYATIQRRLVGLRVAARLAGSTLADHPAITETLAGIRRTLGTKPTRQAAPVTKDTLGAIVATCGNDVADLAGLRDRALLLVGFACALRRSELVALTVADLADHSEGLVVTVRKSKTDQDGAGRTLPLPYGRKGVCPVRALRAWLAEAGIKEGPLFRSVNRHGHVASEALSDKSVALVIKSRCEAAGIDSARFSGHSLRAGLATAAAAAGVAEADIMRTTGHASSAMVRRYVREANLFNRSAAAAVLG